MNICKRGKTFWRKFMKDKYVTKEIASAIYSDIAEHRTSRKATGLRCSRGRISGF